MQQPVSPGSSRGGMEGGRAVFEGVGRRGERDEGLLKCWSNKLGTPQVPHTPVAPVWSAWLCRVGRGATTAASSVSYGTSGRAVCDSSEQHSVVCTHCVLIAGRGWCTSVEWVGGLLDS